MLAGVASAHNDGQWRGEGLLESQDHGAHYNVHHAGVYGVPYAGVYGHGANHDGQWKGEGLAESQDLGQYNGHNAGVYGVYGYGAQAYGVHGAHHDGQWRGEGLVESQDHSQYGHAGVYAGNLAHGIVGVHGVLGNGYAHGYAHGAAPLAHDGRVVDTPEVAHAKAAHFAAKAAATNGAHGVYGAHALAVPVVAAHGVHAVAAHGVHALAAHGYAHGGAPLAHDGRVVDTPEVAHAKAAHFAAVAAAGAHEHHDAHHHHW